ncbi:hypothetical protein AVEN_90008-1 [Araneus ventricosus]|uniref:Uncharacterized protein n=1 Tax=Araneus ventricosus TaxID=182803 RepID=A0A4Y2DAC0_ARAVE|nr:hypothetical protein AVEN_90008-1 [Araneus ventricosus]
MTRTTPELAPRSPNFRYKYCLCSGNDCIILLYLINPVLHMLVGGSLPAGPLLALHPSWVGRASVAIFAPHQREVVWSPRMIQNVQQPPNTGRIFSGIGFRTWKQFQAPKPKPYR